MSVERRGSVRTSLACAQLITDQEEAVTKTKPFTIDKWQVVRAYELVKANAGAAGIDQQSIADFDKNRKNNLYPSFRTCLKHYQSLDSDRLL